MSQKARHLSSAKGQTKENAFLLLEAIAIAYLLVEILKAYTSSSALLPVSYLLVAYLGVDHLLVAYSLLAVLLGQGFFFFRWAAEQKPTLLYGAKGVERPPPPVGKPLLDQFRKKEAAKEQVVQVRPEVSAFVSAAQLDSGLKNVYAGVTKDDVTGEIRYVVMEPHMNQREMVLYRQMKKLLVDELDVDLRSMKSREKAEEYLSRRVRAISKRYGYGIPAPVMGKLLYYFSRDFIRLGKIEPLLHDQLIEDISCDGAKVPIYIWHREYESIPTNVAFENDEELNAFVSRLAYVSKKHVSLANPIVDASLPDGSRVQITYGREVTQKGSTFTIRRFRPDPLTIVDLIKYGTISSEVAAYLWYLIEKKFSVLIAGGTAAGKTSTLNTLAMFITPGQKIVSVEDTAELNLPHENWIQSVTRGVGTAGEITLFDLLRAALRQRPDVIIVGEVRGQEAYTLFQAVATGHGGLGTIHADSVDTVITRLTSEPMNIPKSVVGTTLDCVTMQLKLRVGERSVRRVVGVTELVGYDPASDKLMLGDVYKWDAAADKFVFSGRSKLLDKITQKYGTPPDQIRRELQTRKLVLDWLASRNIRSLREVSARVREFYANPEAVANTARFELEAKSA